MELKAEGGSVCDLGTILVDVISHRRDLRSCPVLIDSHSVAQRAAFKTGGPWPGSSEARVPPSQPFNILLGDWPSETDSDVLGTGFAV